MFGVKSEEELQKDLEQEFMHVPSEEDLARILTANQLEQLCRRHRCYVDMEKWNLVNDFAEIYQDEGRLKGKSQKFINKLLVKSYTRNKDLFMQRELEKQEQWTEEWKLRKKLSLLKLDMWEYKEKQGNSEKVIRCTTNASVISCSSEETEQIGVDIDMPLNTKTSLLQKQSSQDDVEYDMLQFNTESMTAGTTTISSMDLIVDDEQHTPNLSELLETQEVQIFNTESQNYNNFHERITQASTQDLNGNYSLITEIDV